MKKITILLFLIGTFLLINSPQNFAFAPQTDTVENTIPDDLDFTPVESTDDSLTTNVVDAKSSSDSTAKTTNQPVIDRAKPVSLWITFGLGLLAGVAAFFLPCIFPMVPLTVGFFTKRAESKAKGIRSAIIYGLSIIVIYVGLGVIITLIWGASALNQISTNGFFNILIFLILVIFGISFLGAFEITLPSSFVNKLDSKSDSKGLSGIFFMAATLPVVSFSCT